jgi:hypothetical protein
MERTPREIWAKRVERWQSSELTAKEFAAEIGVNAHTLAHWKWQLGKQAATKTVPRRRRERSPAAVSFTELAVEPVSVPPTSAIEIVVDAGLVIRVSTRFDEDTLRRVLGVVRVAA